MKLKTLVLEQELKQLNDFSKINEYIMRLNESQEEVILEGIIDKIKNKISELTHTATKISQDVKDMELNDDAKSQIDDIKKSTKKIKDKLGAIDPKSTKVFDSLLDGLSTSKTIGAVVATIMTTVVGIASLYSMLTVGAAIGIITSVTAFLSLVAGFITFVIRLSSRII